MKRKSISSKNGARNKNININVIVMAIEAASDRDLKRRGMDRCMVLLYNSIFLEGRVALKTRPDSPDPICSGGSTPISHDNDMLAPSPPSSSLYKITKAPPSNYHHHIFMYMPLILNSSHIFFFYCVN